MDNIITCGDCFELLKKIPPNSVDMVLTDPPYKVTKNAWDVEFDLAEWWAEILRVTKENGAIVIFAQDKFTCDVINSQRKIHKYNLIWDKVLTSGFLNANRMPLRGHEDICVFYRKLPQYTPQKHIGEKSHGKGNGKAYKNNNYGDHEFVDNAETAGNMKHPGSILTFAKPHPSIAVHPTQKPVELLEFLIKSYTNEGDTVLDTFMGSGSTGVACENTGRGFIGFEMDETYFGIAKNRLENKK